MDIKKISPSGFKAYSLCQWQYYLKYVLGMQELDVGAPAILGQMFHKACEILSRTAISRRYADSKYWNPSYVMNICYRWFCKKYPEIFDTVDTKKLETLSAAYYELVNGAYSPIRSNTLCVENRFMIELSEPDFYIPETGQFFAINGVIDRVDQIDEKTLEIVDYKTGSRTNWDSSKREKRGPLHLVNDIQCQMYHLAAKTLYPQFDNFKVTLLYVTDGGAITAEFCDYDLMSTRDILARRFKAIAANEDPTRNVGWHCKKICDFGKTGVCDDIWRERQEASLQFVECKYKVLNGRG